MKKKIRSSLITFDKFLKNADDTTLNYLKLSKEQQQIMLDCTTDIYESDDTSVMAIAYDRENNYANIFYNPAIKNLEQNHVTKIVLHELGHVHEKLRHDDKMAKIANSKVLSWLYQNRWSEAFNTGIDIVGTVVSEVFPGAGVLAILGLNALAGIGLYPARQMEIKCDDFADKIMPEITYAENDTATYAAMNETEEDEIAGQAGRVIALTSTHPSTYHRKKRSKVKCAEYLKQKKEMNIASIYKEETKKQKQRLDP